MKLKICENCGKLYIPRRSNEKRQKFCSPGCRTFLWVNKNRKKLNANVRKYRARRYLLEGRWTENGPKAKDLKRWMIEIKSNPCCDCGQKFPVCCMDFDHRFGETKKYNVGSMFAHHYSRELIEEELKKCDLVCSNCHRIRTQKRKVGNARQQDN